MCQTIKQGQGSLGPQESVTSKDLKENNNLFKKHVNLIKDKLENMDLYELSLDMKIRNICDHLQLVSFIFIKSSPMSIGQKIRFSEKRQ